MGIGRDGFYTTKDICEQNATYNIILSGRGAGKSYAIAYENTKDNPLYTGYLWRAWETKKCTVAYLRRFNDDVKASLVEDDFADKDITKITKGKYDHVKVFRGKMYFAKLKDDGTEEKAPWHFGQVFALNIAGRYKSRQYPDITDIVFEESVACDNERYLPNETLTLANLVSTIFRDRSGKVWLLGNTVSRHSPYYTDWGLRGVAKMKVGQIDLYEKINDDGSVIKIAVELSPNKNTKNKMFFGKNIKSIKGSEWQTEEYCKLPNKLESYDMLYEVQIIGSVVNFNLKLLLQYDGSPLLYIYPASRLYSDLYTLSNICSLEPNIHKRLGSLAVHNLIRSAWKDGKVAYCDNITGQDFADFMKNDGRGILS